jgi:hydroxyacylglutathione hydrolase
MKLEQIYTGCIAQAAYYLECDGEAAIFDPLREVQPYIDKASAAGVEIKYIFETHFHADFVSGHIDLAKKTGATIVYGPNALPEFEALVASDNQVFQVGSCKVQVLHTPGHTLESTTYLLTDENGNEHGIITGDTLFIGDVGRPDLAQALTPDLTQEKLAGLLYESLRNRIMPLDDSLIVYPSHGAGSACGKNMSKETTDTLGNQKKTNYALRHDMTKDEFIREVLDGLGAPPSYFPQNVKMNIQGYTSLDQVIERGSVPLSATEFRSMATDDVVILDVRHEDDFVRAHIPGSVFIGIQGNFAPWVGSLLMDVGQKLLLVIPTGKEQETITRLARVGFDNVLGYLNGGIEAWTAAGYETDAIRSITPEQFAAEFDSFSTVVDSRKPGEFAAERIKSAINLPLDTINNNIQSVPEQEFYLHCAGGYRSVIMASILKKRGIHNFINVEKGIGGIKKTGLHLDVAPCSMQKA